MIYYSDKDAKDFIGACANNLDLLRDRRYNIDIDDFENKLHKIMFSVLQNLALEKDIHQIDGVTMANYLSKYDVQYAYFKENNGVEILDLIKDASKNISVDFSYKNIRKMTVLRNFNNANIDVSDILDINTLDVVKQSEQIKALEEKDVDEIINHVTNKVSEIKRKFSTTNRKQREFNPGSGIKDILKSCKEAPKWGKTFQSKYINTIIRGMQGSKYMIRSAPTGGGKSRQAIGDAANLSVIQKYDIGKDDWVENKDVEDVLFITTELVEEEVQLALLAYVSGINEIKIKNGKWTKYEEERLNYAAAVIENSKLHCHFISDFTIEDIETIIERNIIQNKVKYVFFDYIQITPAISAEMHSKFKMTLREDQILANLSAALKEIANYYDVFIATSTQLNRSYKNDPEPDATHMRGGMATLDKADHGIISMPVGTKEKEKLNDIVNKGFSNHIPNMGHVIIKNRGGSYKGVIVWTHYDFGNMREYDCFVTSLDYEIISNIAPTVLEQTQPVTKDLLEKVINLESNTPFN